MIDEKVKKTLRHYIDLEHYSNSVASDIEEELVELYAKCNEALLGVDFLKTKSDYNIVHAVMENYLSEFQKSLNERLSDEASKTLGIETEFLIALYGDKIATSAATLPKILFTPVDTKDTIKTFAERSVKNVKRTYDTAMRAGYTFGQSSSDIKQNVLKNLKVVTNGIHNGIITAIPSVAKTTDRIIFLQNEEPVTWVATLDGKTCIQCASYSGLQFPSISMAPNAPLHNLCRCFLMPTKYITGKIPEFEEFIEQLDEEDQESVLGKNRFDMWKNYGIKLDKFLNNGTVIPYKELKNLI